MAERKVLRCAVYTRKSTEFGLEQDFNSLDAQREACEAYIKSQAHEGWRLLPARYDDGGLSGATLERPGLQTLLAEVKAGKIDTVVVYKVDRLTRSLADFAKLVELFDAHGVSFVSITQQFNTTTSMGRLTLNVLLSFAQFEREVTAERIRDKIAASRQKGIWMGGSVPLGYFVKDRKLLVDEAEAEQVRTIFQRYLELGSIKALKQDLDAKGILTKRRVRSNGEMVGGIPFFTGPLTYLLKNRVYIGESEHKDKSYPGQHAPIIDRELFDAVQAKFSSNAVTLKRTRSASGSFLMGIIFDDAGNRMTPTHTQKGPARYRYYLSAPLNHGAPGKPGSLSRVPAQEVERAVVDMIHERLFKRSCNSDWEQPDTANPAPNHRALVDAHLQRIVVSRQSVAITFKPVLRSDNDESDPGERTPDTVIASLHRKNRNPRCEIIDASDGTQDASLGMRGDSRQVLLQAIAKARTWARDLIEGRVADTSAIAEREGRSERYVRATLPLAFLAPDIVTAIIANTVPEDFGISKLTVHLPYSWAQQRQILEN
jgi:DNA invertase Pin-like site-specific DNA recombinase